MTIFECQNYQHSCIFCPLAFMTSRSCSAVSGWSSEMYAAARCENVMKVCPEGRCPETPEQKDQRPPV